MTKKPKFRREPDRRIVARFNPPPNNFVQFNVSARFSVDELSTLTDEQRKAFMCGIAACLGEKGPR